jgi:polar amino acid transport system substrate-binding protein
MQYLFIKMKGFAIADRIKTGEQYGLMMTKDSPLLGKINDAITAMKKDGTMQTIHKKWFGSDAPAASSTATEMPIPKA